MKISLVSETYFPQINGVSRALGRLVDTLLDNGDHIQLIIPDYPEFDTHQVFPERVIPVRLEGMNFPFYKEIKLIFGKGTHIRERLREFDPDVVHIATEGPMGWTTLRNVVKMGYPLVTSFHTNFPDYLTFYKLGWLKGLSWNYLRWFHDRGEITLCPSRSIREQLEQRGLKNVSVWGRGVDCGRFTPARRKIATRRQLGVEDDAVAILYVGRIADEKNLKTLFQALNCLNKTGKPWKMIMVGDGPAKVRLQQQSTNQIYFTGYRKGDDLADIYAAADIFVFPSLTDTFGNVILEGMASGIPAVGFDAPGPRDIIKPQKTGLLVYERTPAALARNLTLLIENPRMRTAMSREARDYALACRWDQINAVVRNAYEAAMVST